VGDFARTVTRELSRVVPFDGTCLLTFDPATLLPTGEIVEHGLPPDSTPRLTEIELRERDYNKFTTLARSASPAASLSDATGGVLDRSLRQRELRGPSGFDDELRVVLSDVTGTWGALTLLRDARRPPFSPTDVRLVASLATLAADGLRRAALLHGRPDGVADHHTGLVVLAGDGTVELCNKPAARWLDELAGDRGAAGSLPLVVSAVAARARDFAHHTPADQPFGAARARVRTRTGRWLVVRASLLDDAAAGFDGRVAVLLEPAQSPELAPLVADAYGLTERERRVTELVARGYTTTEIATRLHVSPYTVQDHLKSIFDKTDSSSRGALVARLFFDHYVPRLGHPDASH
jgi:DNA-binding CsgD family transcriptional regulator